MEIDLVYLWVDGSDPKWLERRNRVLKNLKRDADTTELKGRYGNHNELKYSLRSVEKHLPWIRNIYIVTDNQIPFWLNVNNEKVKIINHQEILPAAAIPCFNSVVIEYFVYKIPNLSEHFLLANDDLFVNKDLKPSFFFSNRALPKIRLQYQPFQKLEFKLKKTFGLRMNNYRKSILSAIQLIEKKYNKYYPGVLHHNIDAFVKNDFKILVEQTFKNEIDQIVGNHFRSANDIQRVLIAFDNLANKRGELHYVKRSESLRLKVHKTELKKTLKHYNPSLFCINDTERATDLQRAQIEPMLDELFPEKSSFEI